MVQKVGKYGRQMNGVFKRELKLLALLHLCLFDLDVSCVSRRFFLVLFLDVSFVSRRIFAS